MVPQALIERLLAMRAALVGEEIAEERDVLNSEVAEQWFVGAGPSGDAPRLPSAR